MKVFQRRQLGLALGGVVFVVAGVVAMLWAWPRVAENFAKQSLHAALLRETAAMSEDVNELGYTITPWSQPGCTHEAAYDFWLLPRVGCQDISVIKPKGSLAEVQKDYAIQAPDLTQGLLDRGWQQQGDGLSGLTFTKRVDGALCRLYITPVNEYSSELECDRNIRVLTIPAPGFFEFYGGG